MRKTARVRDWDPSVINQITVKTTSKSICVLPLRFGHTSWAVSVDWAYFCSFERAPAGSRDCWTGWRSASCLQDRSPGSWQCLRGLSSPRSSCAAEEGWALSIMHGSNLALMKISYYRSKYWLCVGLIMFLHRNQGGNRNLSTCAALDFTDTANIFNVDKCICSI